MEYLNRYRNPWEQSRKPFQFAEKVFQNISDGHYLASSSLNIHFLGKKKNLSVSKVYILNNYYKVVFYNNVVSNDDIYNKNIQYLSTVRARQFSFLNIRLVLLL